MRSNLAAALDRAIALVLAALLLWAAVAKVRDPDAFARTVGDFGLVPDAWVRASAWGIVAAELVVAGLLPLRRALGAALACGLFTFFLAVLAYGLGLGLDVDCGCFGPGEHVSLREALVRDVVLLGLAAGLLRHRLRRDA